MLEQFELFLKPVLILVFGIAVVLDRLLVYRHGRKVLGLSKKEANRLSRHVALGGKEESVSPITYIILIPGVWAGFFMVFSAIFLSDVVGDFLFTMSAAVYAFILFNYVFMLSASYHFGLNGDVHEMIKTVDGEDYLRFLYRNTLFSLNSTPRWLVILSGTLWWLVITVSLSGTLYGLSLAYFPI